MCLNKKCLAFGHQSDNCDGNRPNRTRTVVSFLDRKEEGHILRKAKDGSLKPETRRKYKPVPVTADKAKAMSAHAKSIPKFVSTYRVNGVQTDIDTTEVADLKQRLEAQAATIAVATAFIDAVRSHVDNMQGDVAAVAGFASGTTTDTEFADTKL